MAFKKWTPIANLQSTFYIEGFYDDYEGVRVLLKAQDDNQKMLRISFDSPLSYRNTDEGDLLKTISDNDLTGWSFFCSNESMYLSWFIEESYGIRASDTITHFAIYTPNDCLDVLSHIEPKVEWLK